MEIKHDEEDLCTILLCSFLSSFTNFRDTILYSCNTLTLDEVYDALFTKKKMMHLVVGSKAQVEDLMVQWRTHMRVLVMM